MNKLDLSSLIENLRSQLTVWTRSMLKEKETKTLSIIKERAALRELAQNTADLLKLLTE